jgi:hypothetical protein
MLTPETAMLTGRVLRTGVVRFTTRPELVVEVDIALPGRDVDKLFGVISPDRNPKVFVERRRSFSLRHVSLLCN